MGLFQNAAPRTPAQPPLSGLAVTSLVAAITGFLNVIGFFAGPILAHAALIRLRQFPLRGRRLAIAALWISYVPLLVGAITLIVILLAAYAALPSPPIF